MPSRAIPPAGDAPSPQAQSGAARPVRPAGTLYAGIMSGTSMDGVDAVLADIRPGRPPQLLAEASVALPAALRAELLALNTAGDNELDRAARAAHELAGLYAQAVAGLLYRSEAETHAIAAIGAHGQTVRHRPELGYSWQLNAPALLAELTGIPVVADFRSRDVAAGGQGAPLVPAFHDAVFAAGRPRAVLNLGGMANVTLLRPEREPEGFDTGPANVLLDLWCERHTGRPYDEDGRWAGEGRLVPGLLEYLIRSEPWFALPPPKSTGRDRFHAAWLQQRLDDYPGPAPGPADVQATLQMLTARTVAQAVAARAPDAEEMLVCGGGARNGGLMRDLAHCLQRPVQATDRHGVPAQHVEALAFAWLAWAHVNGVPAGLPAVTGARGKRVLGAYYPA